MAKRKKKPSPEVLERARELHEKNGIPEPLALEVAGGKLTVAEALQRMLREDRAEKLAARLGIPLKMALDIVDGKLDEAEVPLKYRARQYVDANPVRSALTAAFEEGRRIGLLADPRRILVGRITGLEKYELCIQPEDGEPESLLKVFLHVVFEAEDRKRVEAALGTDAEVAARNLEPEHSPKRRRHFKHAVFHERLESGEPFSVTTRRGHVLRGKLTWYSLFELGLELESGPEVTVFRHAIETIEGVTPGPKTGGVIAEPTLDVPAE